MSQLSKSLHVVVAHQAVASLFLHAASGIQQVQLPPTAQGGSTAGSPPGPLPTFKHPPPPSRSRLHPSPFPMAPALSTCCLGRPASPAAPYCSRWVHCCSPSRPISTLRTPLPLLPCPHLLHAAPGVQQVQLPHIAHAGFTCCSPAESRRALLQLDLAGLLLPLWPSPPPLPSYPKPSLNPLPQFLWHSRFQG